MGMQPSVFISCVSPEFRSIRQRIANILMRLGYTPVFQEIFGAEPGDLREVLHRKIDICEGLIQVIGKAYGAELPAPDAEFGRVSYTQYEFLYARKRGKKTWLIFAGAGCSTDTPVKKLDLPHTSRSDAEAYQAERRALQQGYVAARMTDGHLYQPVRSDDGIELAVERLNGDLSQLRLAFEAWQEEVRDRLTDLQHITAGKIRAQLVCAADNTYQTALQQLNQVKSWQEREKLRDTAERDKAIRLSRIDDLAVSFAELEGTARSTNVLDEMTRILAEEGVDEALAYVRKRQPGILETVKARAFTVHERNRADLRPLLKGVQLIDSKSKLDDAANVLQEILRLEPEWTEALGIKFWFLMRDGDHAQRYGTINLAIGKFKAAELVARQLLLLERDRSEWKRDLSAALNKLGDLSMAMGDYQDALTVYQSELAISAELASQNPGEQAQHDLSISLDNMGDVHVAMGDFANAIKAYVLSQQICYHLAEKSSSDDIQRSLFVSLCNIATVQTSQKNFTQALINYGLALVMFEKLARVHPTNGEIHRELSICLERMGNPESETSRHCRCLGRL